MLGDAIQVALFNMYVGGKIVYIAPLIPEGMMTEHSEIRGKRLLLSPPIPSLTTFTHLLDHQTGAAMTSLPPAWLNSGREICFM